MIWLPLVLLLMAAAFVIYCVCYGLLSIFFPTTGRTKSGRTAKLQASAYLSLALVIAGVLLFFWEDNVFRGLGQRGQQPSRGFGLTPGSQSSSQPVDQLLRRLSSGNAILLAPRKAKEYNPFSVSLTLSHRDFASLKSAVQNDYSKVYAGLASVKMSERMSAQLFSDDCELSGKYSDPMLQAVSESQDTVWTWVVYCGESGDKQFTAKLNAILLVDGKETPWIETVGEATVHVEINSLEWAKIHWQWIISTLALPVFGWSVKQVFSTIKQSKSNATASRHFRLVDLIKKNRR